MIKLMIEVTPLALGVFNEIISELDSTKVHIMNSWWVNTNLKIKLQFEDEDTFKEFVRKFYSL